MNETEINKLTYLNNVKLTYQDLLDKMNMIVYNGSIYGWATYEYTKNHFYSKAPVKW